MKDIVTKFISDTLESNITIPWSFNSFRSSSLPLCQLQLLFGNKKTTKSMSFEQRYSFFVGRAMKDLLREFWVDNLWGDWICTDSKDCGVTFNNTRLKDGKCIRCGSSASYLDKLVVDQETGFTGHCDAIVYCDDLNGYLLVKINSKNNNIISAATCPYESEILQVSALATILHKTKYLPIVGRAVLWIGKPKATPYKVWTYEGLGEELIKEQFQLKKDFDKKLVEGDIKNIIGCCTTKADAQNRDCPFGDKCLSQDRDQFLNELKRMASWKM